MMVTDFNETAQRFVCGNCGLFVRTEPDEVVFLGEVAGERPEETTFTVERVRNCRACGHENVEHGEEV